MALDAFLKKNYAVDPKDHNYTKIGAPKLQVSGGVYSIPLSEIDEFRRIYIKHVFEDRKQAYLTEKQLEEGPILIDIDFRYDPEVENRIHTKEHIIDFIQIVLENINKILNNNNKQITCYIFEKDNVNIQETITKDGIHLMINLKMDFSMKQILRNYLLKEISDLWEDIPITNTWSDVLDEKVFEGHANWQLFGSRKPGYEDYKLTYMFNCTFNESWNIKEEKIKPAWILDNFTQLTSRGTTLVHMPLSNDIKEEYERIVEQRKKKPLKKTARNQVKLLSNISSNKYPHEIQNQEELDEYIEDFITNLNTTDYIIKEAYAYTMILPEEFWGLNSFNKWIRVGWALKNTDNRLFVIWLKFSSQSKEFDYGQIPELFEKWNNTVSNKEGVTLRSIMYWCKTTNEKEYIEIRNKTINYYIYYSIDHNTEFDLAMVLYQMYKDSFICVSIKDAIWYEFINNRWQPVDNGYSLRSKISVEMYNIYHNLTKMKENECLVKEPTKGDTSFTEGKEQIIKFTKTSTLLKKTPSKNNIMKESMEIFYDKEFYSRLNTNNYLIGCNNCIVDFKNKLHRKGKHDDYISKTTNLDYYPLEYHEKKTPNTIAEINTFMSQLFPEEELRQYMWEHLASTLLGNNENQTFNIYIGSGANGKSKLIELMSKVLGEYKGTVPITLITQKRSSIGSTSSEIYQLIGIRYAVMQEPSTVDKINEGIMKEITGGDPIQCRALFKESVTFIPQFKLVVATNCYPGMTATDDGTWRRVRAVEYKSKFTHNPYNDPQFPTEEYPHQFKIDTKIDEKFEYWAPVMLSMLVDIAYRTLGKVTDCDLVMKKSDEYRKEQDLFLDFTSECILEQQSVSGEKLKISIIHNRFKNWFSTNHGNIKIPSPKEFYEKIYKKYGRTTEGWSNITLVENE